MTCPVCQGRCFTTGPAGVDACPACAAAARAEAVLAGLERAGETPPPPRPDRAVLTRPDGRLWILALPRVAALALALLAATPEARACEGRLTLSDADSGRIACDDGRTLRWRLPDRDAPETGSRARCAEEKRLGLAAAAQARALAQGRRARLTAIEAADRHGRAVAEVELLEGPLQGRRLGDALTARGLLRPWPHDDEGRPQAARPDWCAR